MNTARAVYQTGTGTQTAALAVSGTQYPSPATGATEKWDGSSWTTVTSMNTSESNLTGGGVQTSAIYTGGGVTTAESYNVSTWTGETAAPSPTFGGKGFAGQSETSNLFIGIGPTKNATFSYNGTAWSDLGHTLAIGKNSPAGGSQQGTTTAAIVTGGYNPTPAQTTQSEQYNGSVWTTAPSLGTARVGGAGAGSASSCLAVGGETPQKDLTEEFTAETSAVNIETLTTS